MIKIDGAYLYEIGANLRAIAAIPEESTTRIRINHFIAPAYHSLDGFINSSVYSPHIKTVRNYAVLLLNSLNSIQIDFSDISSFDKEVSSYQISILKDQFQKFEVTFLAEMQNSPLYLVFSKGGFDVANLTDQGLSLFPSSLPVKAPEASADAMNAAKCVAFELFTAAGFHLHRANEAVLRRYFDEVAGSQHRPKTRNIGDYLKKMESLEVGDRKVIDVLKSIKDLHRNPLMHPEDQISDADEALSLYAAIRAAIGYMLDRMPLLPAEAELVTRLNDEKKAG